ncbi:MAG: MBL fold metallo-hydrolase [Spirochaetales bacterium]|nr:MBL fold metallo-hydrolase [Spirochaetales bacterium]
MKITENIYFFEGDYINKKKKRYSEYYKGIGSSNFLILKGREQILVDSGIHVGPHIPRLARQLAEDGIELSETKKVVFSHAHPDHILYAKEIAKHNKLDFFIHEHNEQKIINSDYFFEYFFNFPAAIQREVYKMPKPLLRLYLRYIGYDFRYLKISHFFDEKLPFEFDIPIKPVHLPGHSTGHLGFYFPGEKVFYSADLFDTRTNPGASIGSSDSDFVSALRDIERVMEMDIDVLLPGHGRIIEGSGKIQAFLKKLLKNTRRYPEQIMELLPAGKDEAMTLSCLTRTIYPDSIASNGFIRHIITYNCLRYLQRKHRVGNFYRDRAFHWHRTGDGKEKYKLNI